MTILNKIPEFFTSDKLLPPLAQPLSGAKLQDIVNVCGKLQRELEGLVPLGIVTREQIDTWKEFFRSYPFVDPSPTFNLTLPFADDGRVCADINREEDNNDDALDRARAVGGIQ